MLCSYQIQSSSFVLALQLQSHQIFHVFVVTAAFVHYYGLVRLLSYRMAFSDCLPPEELAPFADPVAAPVASEL